MDKTEIINLTEASGVSDNDYVMVDSPTQGVRKYKASNFIGGEPTLTTKSITANGTYEAVDDNAQGYSEVTVNVPKAPDLILDKTVIIDNTKSTNTVPLNLPSEYDYYIISLQDIKGCHTSPHSKTDMSIRAPMASTATYSPLGTSSPPRSTALHR